MILKNSAHGKNSPLGTKHSPLLSFVKKNVLYLFVIQKMFPEIF